MQAVTAGDDGALMVVPLEGSDAAQSIMEPRSSASYAAARWSSPQAFVTAGTTGAASLAVALSHYLQDIVTALRRLAPMRMPCSNQYF